MKSQRLLLPFIILIITIAVSCNNRPEGVLSEAEMVDLLTDLQLAEAYYNTAMSGTGGLDKRTLEESVLKKHGVSREEMEITIAYYARNIDEYAKLYDKVEKKLRSETGTAGGGAQISNDDIWPYGRHAVFMTNQMSDGISFSIPGDEVKPGNSLEWGMRMTSSDGVEIMLGVEYEDGSSSVSKRSAGGNKTLKIELQTDTALNARRIFGYMTVPSRTMPVWTDSIRLIRADFDSTTYSKIRMQHTIQKPGKKIHQPEIKEEKNLGTIMKEPVLEKAAVDTTFRKQ